MRLCLQKNKMSLDALSPPVDTVHGPLDVPASSSVRPSKPTCCLPLLSRLCQCRSSRQGQVHPSEEDLSHTEKSCKFFFITLKTSKQSTLPFKYSSVHSDT